MKVSVVVPTCRRPEFLERCLRALARQHFDPGDYEVLVVDDASEPATRNLVERMERTAGINLRYLSTIRKMGPAAARNLGWRAARGEIVAFVDDDCLPRPTWLLAGTAAFGEGIDGVSGKTMVPLSERPTDYELNSLGLARSRFITANCFYRRPALEAVGGFDEAFTLPWREDSDLYFRLLKRGKCLVDAPDAVVVHPVRPAKWGVSLKEQRKNMFNALLYKKHPDLYRDRLNPVTPWRYYVGMAGLLGALASVAAGHRIAALAFVVLWGGLTLSFFAARMRGASRRPGHIAEMLVTSILIPPMAIGWRLCGAIKFRVFFI